jgi:hypothetical protein
MTLLLQSGVGKESGRNPHSQHGLAGHTEVRKAADRRGRCKSIIQHSSEAAMKSPKKSAGGQSGRRKAPRNAARSGGRRAGQDAVALLKADHRKV